MGRTYVIGIEATRVVSVKASWRIEIFHEFASKPRLRTMRGVTLLTAL